MSTYLLTFVIDRVFRKEEDALYLRITDKDDTKMFGDLSDVLAKVDWRAFGKSEQLNNITNGLNWSRNKIRDSMYNNKFAFSVGGYYVELERIDENS